VPAATTRHPESSTLTLEGAELGNLELRAALEGIAYTLADLAECFPMESDVARSILTERQKVLRDELARRERLYAGGVDVPDPYAAEHDAWLSLAGDVRRRADVLSIFGDAGHVLSRAGWSNRRQAEEWVGACPWCGGRDRFHVWRGADPGYWCRGCGAGGDAITATRNLIPGCAGFYEAVAWLARQLGLPAPIAPHRPKGNGAGFEYVRGKVVPR